MLRGPFLLRHRCVGLNRVPVANSRVDPYPAGRGEGVVVMDETAFGRFDMGGREAVGDGAKTERVRLRLKRLSVECNWR